MSYPTQKIFLNAATPAVRSKIAAALLAAGALSAALPAQAVSLPDHAVLTITAGVRAYSNNGTQTNVSSGSWFGMDISGDSKVQGTEKHVLSQGTTGLVIGVTTSAGAYHGGIPTAGDTSAIDAPWEFNSSTGSDYVTTAVTGGTTGVNMIGWTVAWNTSVTIPMGTGAWTPLNAAAIGMATSGYANGVGVFSWDGNDGGAYTLDYTATVPTGGFTGTQYALHLVGTVVVAPLAVPDSTVTTVGIPININVLANDSAANGINATTVLVSTATHGATVRNATTGVVTYTPNGGYSGADSFTYTFQDNNGATSNTATVTVAVNNNSAPTAVNDNVSVTTGTLVSYNVVANDTDVDNNLAPGTVALFGPNPQHGTVSWNTPSPGMVTYTPANGYSGPDSFQYTVSDTIGDTSLPATVNVTVSAFSKDWTNSLDPSSTPILVIGTNSTFSMYLNKNAQGVPVPTTTPLSAGPDGGIILGMDQVARGSHSGPSAGTEVTGIDQPWFFASNTGMHFTTGGSGIGVNGDGSLNFTGWRVTWNGIDAINMGGSPEDQTAVRGIAAIACNPAPCDENSAYVLDYSAHVPQGDPSTFGGTLYGLHLEGTVHFLNKALVASSGTIGPGSHGGATGRVTATDLMNNGGATLDTGVVTPCVGDCFDFQVTGLSTGGRVQVVLPLRTGIRPNSTYRKYISGAWHDFDTSSGDTVTSAPLMTNSGNCPGPGSTAYTPGLTAGNRCVRLDIADGGPNDSNPNSGIIGDPSGVAAGAVVVPQKNLATSSGGCSLSADPVSVLKRADWLLLLGFVGWLGLIARRKRTS